MSADPPGLDTAIEAAAAAMHKLKMIWGDSTWHTTTERNRAAYRREAEAVLRAAAPALRAGALREAADEWQWTSYDSDDASAWLRERADRIGGAT